MDTAGYLGRLELDDPDPPSTRRAGSAPPSARRAVPYETTEIQLQRLTTVDPHEAAHRIVGLGRGGWRFEHDAR
jgi:N-hydroxyarylamine O-acetyltransferase